MSGFLRSHHARHAADIPNSATFLVDDRFFKKALSNVGTEAIWETSIMPKKVVSRGWWKLVEAA